MASNWTFNYPGSKGRWNDTDEWRRAARLWLRIPKFRLAPLNIGFFLIASNLLSYM
jgi:hypothetical protein